MWSSKNISSISFNHSRNGNCSVMEKCSGLFISICRIPRRFSVHHELHGYLKKSVKAKSWNIFKLFYNSNKAQCSWDSDKWASHERKSHDTQLDAMATIRVLSIYATSSDPEGQTYNASNIYAINVYYISHVTFDCMFSKQMVSINQCNSAPTQLNQVLGKPHSSVFYFSSITAFYFLIFCFHFNFKVLIILLLFVSTF